MPVTISCRCGQILFVREEYLGQPLGCPRCKAVFTVPAPAIQPAPAPVPPPSPAPPPAPAPEEELVELTMVDTLQVVETPEEDAAGTYQFAGGEAGGVDLSIAGDLARILVRAGSIECLAYGADHQTALAADERTMYFLDLKAKHGFPTRPMHSGPISCLALSWDALWGLSGGDRGDLLLWDVRRRQPGRWLQGHRNRVASAAFSPDGRLAASGDEGGLVRLWDLRTGGALTLQNAYWEQGINCVAFSPDGRLLFGLGSEGKARLWSMRTGQVVCQMAKGSAEMHSAAFSSDGASVLASCSSTFKVRRWNVQTGDRRPCFAGFADRQPRIQNTFVAPNGRALVALGYTTEYGPRNRTDSGGDIEGAMWGGGALGGVVGAGLGAAAWVGTKAVANAIEGASAGATGGHFYLEFWEVASEVALKTVVLGENRPLALACSADGHRVLAGFEDGDIHLYGL
jgi:WD40 repeat protein